MSENKKEKPLTAAIRLSKQLNLDSCCRHILRVMAWENWKTWSIRKLTRETGDSKTTIGRHLGPHLRDQHGLIKRNSNHGHKIIDNLEALLDSEQHEEKEDEEVF